MDILRTERKKPLGSAKAPAPAVTWGIYAGPAGGEQDKLRLVEYKG